MKRVMVFFGPFSFSGWLIVALATRLIYSNAALWNWFFFFLSFVFEKRGVVWLIDWWSELLLFPLVFVFGAGWSFYTFNVTRSRVCARVRVYVLVLLCQRFQNPNLHPAATVFYAHEINCRFFVACNVLCLHDYSHDECTFPRGTILVKFFFFSNKSCQLFSVFRVALMNSTGKSF